MSGPRRGAGGRRRYEESWPNLRTRRQRLSRGAVLLGTLITVVLFASALMRSDEEPVDQVEVRETPRANASVAAVTATATSTPRAATTATAPLQLVAREGTWGANIALGLLDDATRVRVARVIDGDTIDVLSSGESIRVRFYGADTPERDERCYDEASERTRVLVASEVVLVPDARLEDPNGRQLRYVFTSEGQSLEATLVAEGLALAWRGDGELWRQLLAIENEARTAARGCLWGS